MKSMKITAAERKARNTKYDKPCSIDGGDAYPYGLRLSLNSEVLDKLDKTSLPKVGTVITITAKAKVVSVSQRERDDGEKNRDMDLQITDLELGAGSAEDAVREAVTKA